MLEGGWRAYPIGRCRRPHEPQVSGFTVSMRVLRV